MLLRTPPSGEATPLSGARGALPSLTWFAQPVPGTEIWRAEPASAGTFQPRSWHLLGTRLQCGHSTARAKPETSTAAGVRGPSARVLSSCSLRGTPRGDQGSEGLEHHMTRGQNKENQVTPGKPRAGAGGLRAGPHRLTRRGAPSGGETVAGGRHGSWAIQLS